MIYNNYENKKFTYLIFFWFNDCVNVRTNMKEANNNKRKYIYI